MAGIESIFTVQFNESVFWILEPLATLIEYTVLFSLYGLFFKSRFTGRGQMLASKFTVCIILVFITQYINSFQLFSYISIIVTILSSAALSLLIYKADYLRSVAVAVVFVTALMAIDFLSLSIGELIFGISEFTSMVLSGPSFYRMIFIIIVKILLVLLYFAFKYNKMANAKLNIKTIGIKPVGGIIAVGAFCFFCMNYLITALVTGDVNEIQKSALVAWFFMILFIVSALASLQYFAKFQEQRKESILVNTKSQMLEENSIRLNEAYSENAKNAHDYNNHIRTVKTLLEDEDYEGANKYLAELVSDVTSKNRIIYTGVEIVDAVLNNKKHEAENKEINVVVKAVYPANSLIRSVDICAILVNLIDNSIEACEKIAAIEDRYININIACVKSMILIKITNSAKESPYKDGVLKTDKNDKERHGFGIKIIKSAIKRYDGTIEQKFKNGEFCTSVLINY